MDPEAPSQPQGDGQDAALQVAAEVTLESSEEDARWTAEGSHLDVIRERVFNQPLILRNIFENLPLEDLLTQQKKCSSFLETITTVLRYLPELRMSEGYAGASNRYHVNVSCRRKLFSLLAA